VTLREAAGGELPSWLGAILDPALDPAPERRPTAAQFAVALRQATYSQAA
jgi:hypothetical protein